MAWGCRFGASRHQAKLVSVSLSRRDQNMFGKTLRLIVIGEGRAAAGQATSSLARPDHVLRLARPDHVWQTNQCFTKSTRSLIGESH